MTQAIASKQMKAHLISHTHWDREWYKTFQHFRVRLVYFMDKLLTILDQDENFKCFMLDGHMAVVEDYLHVKPQNFERIKRFVQDGRLVVGPWYIQPDEFVPDAESLVRNLLIGDRMAKQFGRPMKVGYLPDSFGQSGAMPQILKGFDIPSAVMMRGVPLHELKSSEFRWKAINGDNVVAVYLPLGYSNSMFLPTNFEKADIRMDKTVEELERWATTDNILLMNGVDHEWAEPHIPQYIKYLNKKHDTEVFEQTTLEEYINAVLQESPELKTLSGELITPERNRVHTSIVSVRMYEKQANRKAQSLLQRFVEPISVIGWLNHAQYPQELINQAWKYLIQNQAHDSIGGCCVDDAHAEIDQRFRDVNNIGSTLINSYARAVARRMADDRLSLVVFNNSMTTNRQIVNATAFLDDENFTLRDGKGHFTPYQINNVTDINAASLGIWLAGSNLKETKKKIEFSFYGDFESNFGYKVYSIDEGKKQSSEHEFNSEYYSVTVHENGCIDVLDKETGRLYSGLHMFEDCGDAGDTYNFTPVNHDTVVTSEHAKADINVYEGELKKTIAINLQLEVPLNLVDNDNRRSDETVLLPITTYVTLYSDLKRIDFRTELDNTAKDHRLRVLFPSSITANHSYAEIQFGTLKRPNQMDESRWEIDKWSEKPLPIYNQQKFVDLTDGQYGLAVLNLGLPEYEIYNNTTIALTLFRGVQMMGKRELSVRPGRPSGIEVSTPDALCLGKQVFEYAIVPHKGNWDEAGIPAAAIEFDAKPLAIQNIVRINNLHDDVELFEIETLTKHLESEINEIQKGDANLFSVDHSNLIVSAVKKAEDEDALIIRLYNSGASTISNAAITFGFNVRTVNITNLNEEIEGKQLIATDKQIYKLPEITAYSAMTLKITK